MPPGVDLLFFWTRGLILDGAARAFGVTIFLLIGALVAIYGFRVSRHLE